MNQNFMKEKKILPLVLSMSLPMVISMAVNSLYNIVDSYFVAKVSENAMTALALIYPIQNLITAIAVGFGIGINAVIAYYMGSNEQEKANQATTQGLFLSVIHGILMTIFSIVGMPFFLKMFTPDAEVTSLALRYSNIAFSFSIIISLGISFEKIFQSVGKMKISMISMICGFAANIILDPLLIFGIGPFPKMGIEGAALATGIGQTLSLCVYLIAYLFQCIPLKIQWKFIAPDRRIPGKMYAVGIPASLNMALPSLLISALNGILAVYSGAYVLVLGVYYKLQTFIYLSANGIVQGIRPLVGYNFGAGEYQRVHKIYTTALRLSIIIMVVGTGLSWAIPDQLFSLFTENSETIQKGVTVLHIISLGFIASSVSVTSSGALEGLGKGLPSLLISLARYVVIIIPAAFILSKFLGASGVWWAFPFSEIVTAIFSYYIYRKNTPNVRQIKA